MSSITDTFPMYPGYALGSLIHKSNLMLPVLNKKRLAIESELQEAYREKTELPDTPLYKQVKDSQQFLMILANDKIERIKSKFEEVCGQIRDYYKEKTPSVEETLPIDSSLSKIRTENRSFQSEKMQHLIFRKATANAIDRTQLQEKVNQFVSQLFSESSYSITLPSGAVEGVVNSIENLLDTETQISLVGSFITLPRVITMDPVRIREGSKIGDNLKQNARQYYVLTEAVLGAAFLGIGKSTFVEHKETIEKETINPVSSSFMSRLAMVSFISQGVIPKTSKDATDVNLWSVYTHWKEALQTDFHSGYPIGFKVRKLADILSENMIDFLNEDKDDNKNNNNKK